MRIAYILNTLQMGGAERQVLALAERMRAHRHVVKLIVLREPARRPLRTHLDVVHLGATGNPLRVLRSYIRALAVVRDFRPNVIHSNQFHGNMLGRALKLMMPSIPLVCAIHNVQEGGRARMLAYRLTDGLATRTVAVCDAARDRFARMGAIRRGKSSVIVNGMDAGEFAPDPARRIATREEMQAGDRFLWVAVGRLAPAKDYATMLRAFAKVGSVYPGVRLWIAGEGKPEYVAGLQRMAEELAIAGEVRWLGLREDVAALLDAADGYVLSSAWEGMPLALGEAMAMEKPFVATDVGGVGEMAGNCGTLTASGDAGALATAMIGVMRREADDLRSVGRASRARIVEHFGVEANTIAWHTCYEKAVARRR